MNGKRFVRRNAECRPCSIMRWLSNSLPGVGINSSGPA